MSQLLYKHLLIVLVIFIGFNSIKAQNEPCNPANIIASPLSTEACLGVPVSFKLSTEGSNLTYRWYKLPDVINPICTNDSLFIAEITHADDADYQVVVANECGEMTSDTFHLTVKNLPIKPYVGAAHAFYGCAAVVGKASHREGILNEIVPHKQLEWFNNPTHSGLPLPAQWEDTTESIRIYQFYPANSDTIQSEIVYAFEVLNGCYSEASEVLMTVFPLPPNEPVIAEGRNLEGCGNIIATGIPSSLDSLTTLEWWSTPNQQPGTQLFRGNVYTENRPGFHGAFIFETKKHIYNPLTGNYLICYGAPNYINMIIKPIPSTPSVVDVIYCQNEESVALTADGDALLWYTDSISGVGSAIAPIPSTDHVGTQSYWVTQNVNGCESPRIEIKVIINPLPSFTLTAHHPKCFGELGSISTTILSDNEPFSFQWNQGDTISSIENLEQGTYILTIKDKNGCFNTDSVSIQAAPMPLIPVLTPTNAICTASNGQITTEILNGAAPFQYVWNTGVTTSNLSEIASGQYILTVTDANGCTAVDSVIVESTPSVLAINFDKINAICTASNGQITTEILNGTAPFQYVWNTGVTTSNLSEIASGQYILTVTDANGCTAVDSVVVESTPSVLAINFDKINAICTASNGQITTEILNGAAPFQYAWNTGATIPNLGNISASRYTLTVTDANGCMAIDSVTIESTPSTLTIGFNKTNAICESSNGRVATSIINGTAPFQYVWNTGAMTPNLNNILAGKYKLTVTDANGCVKKDSVLIESQYGGFTVEFQVKNVPCGESRGGRITTEVTGGKQPFKYRWSNGDKTANLNQLTVGTYILTTTDGNGCKRIDTVKIAATPTYFAFSPNKCYKIINKKTGKVLEVFKGQNSNSTLIVANEDKGLPFQKWQISSTTNNFVKIQSRSTSKYLTNHLSMNNSPVYQYTYDRDGGFRDWKIVCTDKPNYYRIIHRASNKALEVKDNWSRKDQNVVISNSNDDNDDAQLFKIEEVACTEGAQSLAIVSNWAIESNVEHDKIQLKWVENTATENDVFEIEKIKNTQNIQINTQKATFGTGLRDYSVNDMNPEDGENKYRITLKRADGSSIKKEITVLYYKPAYCKIFPNPSNGVVNIFMNDEPKNELDIQLYNGLGSLVHREKSNSQNTQMDFSQLTPGMYMIVVFQKGKREFKQTIIIQ